MLMSMAIFVQEGGILGVDSLSTSREWPDPLPLGPLPFVQSISHYFEL